MTQHLLSARLGAAVLRLEESLLGLGGSGGLLGDNGETLLAADNTNGLLIGEHTNQSSANEVFLIAGVDAPCRWRNRRAFGCSC